MTNARTKSIPLPSAVLALSVIVCLGAAAPGQATTLRAQTLAQAEQRETIEHLLDAIHQAAKKLSDRLIGQAAIAERQAIRPALVIIELVAADTGEPTPAITPLRDALLNLPPPSC